MEKQLAFRVFINQQFDEELRSWFDWFTDLVAENTSFDVIEFFAVDSNSLELKLQYFSGNKSLFNLEGTSIVVAKHVFYSKNEYIFLSGEIVDGTIESNNKNAQLPKWKVVLPVIINNECIGVISILSELPFNNEEFFISECRRWAKYTPYILRKDAIGKQNEFTSYSNISKSMEAIKSFVFEINENFEITFSNNSFRNFINNYSGKKVVEQNINLKLLFGSEFKEVIAGIDKALTGEVSFCEKKILIAGSEKTVQFNFSPVAGNEKKCFCIATELVYNDKQFAPAKSNIADINNSLVQFIADIVWVIDERGTIKFVNSAFEKITGFTSQEVIGKSAFEFFSKEEFPNHLQQMLLYLSGKNISDNYFEFNFIDKKGKSIVLESVAINHIEHKEVKGIVISARNISRQASERRELEDKEELYHSLFESLSEAIIITDKNHYLVYCNSLLAKLTGYSMQELGSIPLYQLIVAEEYWKQVLDGINNRLNGKTEQYEVELVKKDKNRIWASITAAPYKDKNGEIVGSVGTIADITERKKVEDEIRWLAKFPEENPSPIIRISDQGKVLYYNKAAKQIIDHFSIDGLLKSEWQNIISKQTKTKSPGKIDIEINGHYFNLSITAIINNSYFNIYAIDITDRIVFQKQLLESEQRLQFLMNSTTEGILVHDDGIIIDLNRALTDLTGFSQEEILGKSMMFLTDETNRELFRENSKKDITLPYEISLNHKNGKGVKVEIIGRAHFYKGRKVKVMAIRDISQRKKAEQESKENEERLNYFFSITSEGILLIDNEKIIDVNTAFLKLTGLSHEEIFNKNISELADATFKEKLFSINKSKNNIETEFLLKNKSGNELFVEVNSKIQEYKSRLIRVVVLRDITQLKLDESEILSAKKTAEEAQQAEEQFLAKMSHEIRTPMNGIIGLTDILLKEPTSHEQEEYLRLIKQSADNLLVIINDILDLSKIRSGKIQFETIDINLREMMRAIYMATNIKAVEKKLDFNFSVDIQIPTIVRGDRIRLNQILLNLISNALKFTKSGKVHYSAELISKTENKVLIKFKVEDTGIGIPDNEKQQIFEAYRQASADTTRKFGGTGLGLPIVKQLVDLQGGQIYLDSEAGVGTSFYFTLPFIADETVEEKTTQSIATSNKNLNESEKNGINILLVDDNFINRLLVIHLLEEKGYSVIEAENGYQAIEKLKEEDIDLILMDISMPDLDGIEATKIIRKMNEAFLRKTPIIAMTAHAFQTQIDEALKSGMNDYLSKPFKPEELFLKINNQLNPKLDLEIDEENQDIDSENYYDLSFLTQYYDNEKEFINSILTLYVKETPASISQIEESLKRQDWVTFKSLSHKIKTNIMMMGIKKAESFLHLAAALDIQQVEEEKMNAAFIEFKKYSLKAIEQIAKQCL